MTRHQIETICWKEFVWRRSFKLEQVHEMLAHLATVSSRGAIIWEIRARDGFVRHLLGADSASIRKITEALQVHGEIEFYPVDEHNRKAVDTVRQIKVSHPSLSLRTDIAESTIRAGLAAMAATARGEEAVLQIILGAAYPPSTIPKNLPDPNAGWLQAVLGNVSQASAETRKSIKEKAEQHSFQAAIRIGVSGASARYRTNCILSALRTLEAAGVRIYDEAEKSTKLNTVHVPWHFPLRLSVKELAGFLMLPSGDEELPGMSDIHPRVMYPPTWYREPTNRFNDRSFGTTLNPANSQKLSISPDDSLEHCCITGPTGSGKSTAILNLVLSDIYAGRSVLVIDPKADLATSILERVPVSRADDVVVIDPSDDNPVGFNPLALPGNPTLIADAILTVFKEIFSDSWGVRSQDVLSAALLTLVETDGASLLWLPPLLTDENFRHKITKDVKDKITLKPFWSTFDNLRPAEREQWVAPVLNKMRQFLFRPGLRGILGQSHPKFQLTDLFSQRKIVLVPLNRGTVGAESARLLGSLVVGLTWTLALSRANVAPERRHLVSLYIDELQDYLTLPTDLSDALAQARGLGVGITMAHQYRAQLPYEIRAGIDANARNKIIFGLNASDAREIATMAPGLEALDFMLYYVTNSHEAIIDEDVFNLVQVELQRRSSMRRGLRNNSPFCTKLVCGDCGSFYGHKIFHAKEKHSKDVWYCNRRYQGSNNCSTPILAEGDLIRYYLQALSEILADKDKYISACKAQMDEADALEKIRSKREKAEAALATDMAKIQALVRENAYISQDQQVYRQRFEEMSEQMERQKNTIAELQEQELRLVGVREKLSRFVEALESFGSEPIFDSVTWNSLVERVLVNPKNLIFEFKNGEKIKITI